MPMIATTIISSIRVKPFCSVLIWRSLYVGRRLDRFNTRPARYLQPSCHARDAPHEPWHVKNVALIQGPAAHLRPELTIFVTPGARSQERADVRAADAMAM